MSPRPARVGTLGSAIVVALAICVPPTAAVASPRDGGELSGAAAAAIARISPHLEAGTATIDPASLAAQARRVHAGQLAVARVSETGRLDVQTVAVDGAEPSQVEATAATLAADPSVLAVSVPLPVRALGEIDPLPATSSTTGDAAAQALTDDPYLADQWQVADLAPAAIWKLTQGAGQVVAVVDTGVQSDHPDLAGQVLPGYDIRADTPGAGTDPDGHGTFVAGLIAAVADNGIGGTGIAPGTKILPVRVLSATGVGLTSDVARGISWAATHGATVINLSLSSSGRDSVSAAAIADAISRGITVVAANGNDGDGANAVTYPAHYPGVIAVGAMTAADRAADFSNTRDVDLVAPGEGVLSTSRESGYATGNGTSFSTPLTAAAAALVRALQPSWTPAQIRAMLLSHTRDVRAAGYDKATGYGDLNLANLVCAAALCPRGDLAVTLRLTGPDTPDAGAPVDLDWQVAEPTGDGTTLPYTLTITSHPVGDSSQTTTVAVLDGRADPDGDHGTVRTSAAPGGTVFTATAADGYRATATFTVTPAPAPPAPPAPPPPAPPTPTPPIIAPSVPTLLTPTVVIRRHGHHGRKTTLRITPTAGQLVTLSVRRHHRWVAVRSRLAPSTGPAKMTLRLPKKFTHQRRAVRIHLAATATTYAWTSRKVR